jgi:CspA family cold shock protein
MPEGTIAIFWESRGFGFVTPDAGPGDIFLHVKDLRNADSVEKGQRVSFEIINDDRRGKPRADRVRVIT